MSRIVFTLAFFLSSLLSFAQFPGYIVNYSNNYLRNTYIFQVTQDSLRNILFRTYNGFIIFDSYQWNSYNLGEKIFDIKPFDRSSSVIIGQKHIFKYSPAGDSIATVASFKQNHKFYLGTFHLDSAWYFVFDSVIYRFDGKKLSQIKPSFDYASAITYAGLLLLQIPGYGYADTAGNLVLGLDDSTDLIFDLETGKTRHLLGFEDNKLLLIDNYTVKQVKNDASPYLKKHGLLDAVKLNDQTIALATQTGGVLLLDSKTLQTRFLLNNLTGLPDNEIFAITADDNGNLWIVHSFGVSFIDFKLSLRNYSLYYGLSGVPTTVYQNDTTVLVGTTSGLFYLTRPSSKELEKLITVTERYTRTQVIRTNAGSTPKVEAKTDLFKTIGKLFSGKKKKKQQPTQTTKPQTRVVKRVYTRRVNKKVITDSALFFQNQHTLIYRKVPKIDNKIKKIFNTPQGLLVITSSEVYKLNRKNPELIFKTNVIYDADYGSFLVLLTADGIFAIDTQNKAHKLNVTVQNPTSVALQGFTLWIGSYGSAQRVIFSNKLEKINEKTFKFNDIEYDPVFTGNINDKIYLISPNALYKVVKDSIFNVAKMNNALIFESTQNGIWLKNENQWISLTNTPVSKDLKTTLNLFDDLSNILTYSTHTYAISSSGQIIRIPNDYKIPSLRFVAYLKNISPKPENNTLQYDQIQNFSLTVYSPFYYKTGACQYRLITRNHNKEIATGWKHYNEFSPILTSGQNTIRIIAKNPLGQTSNTVELNITVKPPFTQTVWFYLLLNFAIALIIILFFVWRQRQLKKRNELLERLVRERTAQIEAQNQELQAQRDEIARQHKLLQEQNAKIKQQLEEISQLHKEITSSIQYAQKIQKTLLPDTKILEKYFSEYFLIYLPRDLVSGDFYWWKEVNGKIIVTVADCTGHGVPGAFITIMGSAFLNEITAKITDPDPGDILNRLRDMVIQSLHQDTEKYLPDGMDMSMIVFDKTTLTIKYSGAYNPVYVIRQKELIELKTQRMPIGRHPLIKEPKPFETKTFEVRQNDLIYMFSDGFQDQIGKSTETVVKFTKRNFKKLLISVSDLSLKDQKDIILEAFNRWKGDNRQTDDVTILGLKI